MEETLEDLVTISVDGRELQAAKGELLWEVCKANGIDIPIFCYHTKLGPVGACRTCLVEQEGVTKGPITACSTPVADGMKIRTRSPIAQKAQRAVFEFLLANHPLDCPICDRGGECPLQDQTFTYGPGTSRYIEPKRHHVKPITLGPTIELDRERCVLCWRCVRFCDEVAEDKSIVLLDRGDHSMVGTFQEEPYVSNFSGNVVELCPVGALTSRKQRFAFRPWELRNRPSVCPHCPMGCNINISVRKNDEVIRFLSRDNPAVDDSWLCDRGRFNFGFIDSPNRLKAPLLRREDGFHEVSWSEALEFIAARLQAIVEESGPEAVVGIASPRLTNEDLFVFRRFMSETVGSNRFDHYPRSPHHVSTTAAGAFETLESAIKPIADLDAARTILVLGTDPSLREPVMELRIRQAVNKHGAKLVVVTPNPIALSAKATRDVRYPEGGFVDVVRALTAGASSGSSDSDLESIAAEFLAEGPIMILYDDSFAGSAAPTDALQAVAELIRSLSTREVGVIPMLSHCNSMGARDLRVVPLEGDGRAWNTPLTGRLSTTQGTRAALLLGVDLATTEQGLEDLRGLDLAVVHELELTETAARADVVLPAASFAEKVGTFTNTERRIQALHVALPSPGMARADWQILVDLSQYFDRPLDYGQPDEVWEDIRRAVPAYAGVSYDDLGQQGARPSVLQPA